MLNDVMKVIKERRSVRNFEDKPIPEEVLKSVLEAIQWAPSWANTQCWEVVIIKDPDAKARVQEAVPKANPGNKAIVDAPVVLALCARPGTAGYFKGEAATKFGDWFMFDLGLAAQNLCLAAHAAGLGTVILGLFDHDKAAAAVNAPEGYELVTLIPVGYPAKVPSAPKRRDIVEFCREDTF
ncbi:MAG: nitroreductase family protein [Desulfobacteraceae bacterium]|nr:nitroreductase family protein [Desulfobacteraceae bacterium]